MKYRRRMSRKSSKRSFRRSASKTHKKNLGGTGGAMRGGIRL